jgi:trk system potassium uptake protein TrkA
MYFIVVGGGTVGLHLAKELVGDGHEVVVIEHDTERAQQIADDLEDDVVMEGDGCEATVLKKAGATRANMLLAVTGDDPTNLAACQVAKQLFGVGRTLARINEPKLEEIFQKLHVDATVSATSAIMAQIEQDLPMHPLLLLLKLKATGLEIVEVQIPEDSRIVGEPLNRISLPYQSMIALIVGEHGAARVPSAETILHAGDEVVALTLHENEELLREALTAPPTSSSEPSR